MATNGNEARTIDEMLALLQQARDAHGGAAKIYLVAKDGKRLLALSHPSIQSTIVSSDGDKAAMSFGWNHDRPNDEYLEIARRGDPDAATAVVLF